jgi:hypothetical protein
MFEDLNLLDFINDVTFINVDENHIIYKEKMFSENFGCCSLYICSASNSYNINKLICEYEEGINNYKVKNKRKKFIFVVKVSFLNHNKFSNFRVLFEDYYSSSKDAFLFWINVKAKYNNLLAEKKVLEIGNLTEEVEEINYYINNKR